MHRSFLGSALALALTAVPAKAAPVAMDTLVAQALRQSPTLQAAEANAESQRALVGVARADDWPQLALAGGYGAAAGVAPAPPGAPAQPGGNAGLTLNQKLFDFGRTAARVQAAEADYAASRSQAGETAVDVAYAVRAAYLRWAEARALADSDAEQLRTTQSLLLRSQSFYKAGVRPLIDVTRAQVAVDLARAELVGAHDRIEEARSALEAAMGGQPVAGEPFFPAASAIADQPLDRLETLALRQHPSLAATQARYRAAEAAQTVAERAGLPELTANAGYGLRNLGPQSGPDWQASVNVALPIFTGFALSSQAAAATARTRAAAHTLEDAQLHVRLGVDQSALAVRAAGAKLGALKAALASARDNFAQARQRYDAGVGSIIEESEAQGLLASAEADWVRGETDDQLAIAGLTRAIGATTL